MCCCLAVHDRDRFSDFWFVVVEWIVTVPDIPKRLTSIDSRIAKIDRRIGFLRARLFWKPSGGDYQEVDIFTHKSNGLTPKNWRTGTEIEAYRHTVTVNKQQFLLLSGYGVYAIQVEDQPLAPCTLESQVTQDDSTDVTLDLAIIPTAPTF